MCQAGERWNFRARVRVPWLGAFWAEMRVTVERGVVATLLVAAAARPGASVGRKNRRNAKARMAGV
jgi:hypothetical protein